MIYIDPGVIFHIVRETDYIKSIIGSMYVPESIIKSGFIHCSYGEEATLLAAEDSFANTREKVFVLKILAAAVLAPVRFESVAILTGNSGKHSEERIIFPHIYGSLNLDAVEGIGEIFRTARGFHWPEKFEPLNS